MMQPRPKKLLLGLQLSIVLLLLMFLCSCFNHSKISLLNEEQKISDLINQGTLALREMKLEEAEGAFSAALEILPSSSAFDGLGCVAFLAGDLHKAEALFLEAHNRDKSYQNVFGNLALLYEFQGELDLASEMYQRILLVQPQDFRARNNFAAYLYDNSLKEASKFELFKALALAKHPTVLDNLKRVKSYE
jgi:tetratricopeptide (TPR) repeat protein